MIERLTPARMADIYFNNLHFASVKAIDVKLRDSEVESETYRYWKEVLAIVEARAQKMKSYRAGKPVKNIEREANV